MSFRPDYNLPTKCRTYNKDYSRTGYDRGHLAVKYKQVEVVTGVCGNKGYIKHKVGIPAYWYKIIYVPKTNSYTAFIAPNTNTGMSKAKLKEYRTTLEEIKKICNF